MPKKDSIKEDIKNKAVALIKDYKTQYEDAVCWVTPKVAFQMKSVIEQCRKNYFGIFDEPIDKQTGREKIWFPLTESSVESAVKNYDVDTKDIKVKANRPDRVKLAAFIRELLDQKLTEQGIGEKIDDAERRLAIDGTIVWKVYEEKSEEGPSACIEPVDLLNFYIDPTANCIDDAPVVIERAIMSKDEMREMTGWDNVEEAQERKNLTQNGAQIGSASQNNDSLMVEVYELFGQIPKYFITGNEKDKNVVVDDGHIVVSNPFESPVVHLIEQGIDKPYVEAWYTRVPGRWYGRGVAEKLIMLQSYLNLIVNIRIVRSTVSQLGLFKVRKGAGITAQSLSKLAVNGAIAVDNMQDIEQFVVQEASQASYNDENNIYSWSQRVTSLFETATGEGLPATTTATIGAIQNSNAQSAFNLIREGFSMFLERVINGKLLPIISKQIKVGDVYRFTPEGEDLRQLDEEILDISLIDYLNNANEQGIAVDVMMAREELKQQLQRMGNDRFIQVAEKIDFKDFDVEVFVGNQKIDENVQVTNLLNMLKVAPEYKDQIVKIVFDTLGYSFQPISQTTMPQMPGAEMMQAPNQLNELTNANTLGSMVTA